MRFATHEQEIEKEMRVKEEKKYCSLWQTPLLVNIDVDT